MNSNDLIDSILYAASILNERGRLPAKLAQRIDALKLVRRPWRPWSRYENEMYRQLEAVLQQESDRLIERLGDNADQSSERVREDTRQALFDQAYWYRHEERLRDVIEPLIIRLASYGALRGEMILGSSEIGVNWNLVNDNALMWARQYSGQLIRNIADTTRRRIQDQLAESIAQSETMRDLVKRIQGTNDDRGRPIFNKYRAQSIAVTESTNSYAEGNSLAWVAAGYPQPRFKPSAHVRCRCYIQPYRTREGEKMIVWYTANDERVCKRKITTPWGEVNGCSGLHLMIVGGDRVGQKL